jgi:cyclophilin family peptidyl-prolyl cis-trans isomerase
VLTLTYPGNRTNQTLTGLPANFTFDAQTGVVSGAVAGTGIITADYSADVTGHGTVPQTLFLRGLTTSDATEVLGTGGMVGETVVHTILTTNPATRVSQTLVGLPVGISFNATTGVVSGLLTTPGNFVATYTATYADGTKLVRPFNVRCIRRPAAPVIAKPIAAWQSTVGKVRDTALAGVFTDADTEAAVRVNTTKGAMDFILYAGATPGTVKNFLNYVKSGRYTDVIFHRSVSNFVIQGGAFRSTGLDNDIVSTVLDPQLKNEAGLRNLAGSISMAKLGGNPDSATNQFFVSNADNQENLDNQNGGFSVFGRVAGNGMTVANAINSVPTKTYSLEVDSDGNNNSFENFPVDAVAAPTTYDPSLNVRMLGVTQLTTLLTYSITGNTNPAVASATITNGVLRLRSLSNGTTTVTVTATDLDGNGRQHNIVVAIGVPLPPPAAFSAPETLTVARKQTPVYAPMPEIVVPEPPPADFNADHSETDVVHPVDAESGTVGGVETYATVAFVEESGFTYTVMADGEAIWNSNEDDSPLVVSAIPSPAGLTMIVIRDTEPTIGETPRHLTVEARGK